MHLLEVVLSLLLLVMQMLKMMGRGREEMRGRAGDVRWRRWREVVLE